MNRKRIIVPILLFGVILSGFYFLHPQKKTALIIDSISTESEFKTKSIKLLSESGFQTSYISGQDVTVNLFKSMPKKNLYILRVHSTCLNNRTWIFTGEQYSSEKYSILQLTDLIHRARTRINSTYFFCVSPEFIQEYNQDGFPDAAILMMGCEGLSSIDLADAFCREGTTVYISWDGYVCLAHTDQAFLTLIEALCSKNMSISESLNYTVEHTGNDPIYFSSLKYYPPDTGYRKVS